MDINIRLIERRLEGGDLSAFAPLIWALGREGNVSRLDDVLTRYVPHSPSFRLDFGPRSGETYSYITDVFLSQEFDRLLQLFKNNLDTYLITAYPFRLEPNMIKDTKLTLGRRGFVPRTPRHRVHPILDYKPEIDLEYRVIYNEDIATFNPIVGVEPVVRMVFDGIKIGSYDWQSCLGQKTWQRYRGRNRKSAIPAPNGDSLEETMKEFTYCWNLEGPLFTDEIQEDFENWENEEDCIDFWPDDPSEEKPDEWFAQVVMPLNVSYAASILAQEQLLPPNINELPLESF